MAVIALSTAGRVAPVSGVANGHEQYQFEASEQITAGQMFYITSTGKAAKANASGATVSAQSVAGTFNSQLFMAIDSARQAGNTVTGVKTGLIDGFDLTALAYGAVVYMNDTAGSIGDAAGTFSTIVGRVQAAPYTGTPSGADKVLRVNCPPLT